MMQHPYARPKEVSAALGDVTADQAGKATSELRKEGKLDRPGGYEPPPFADSEPTSITGLFTETDRIRVADALEKLDVSPSELRGMIADVRARDGIEIAEVDGELLYGVTRRENMKPLATKTIRFGVASDLHIGAKAFQPTALARFVDDCKARKVTHILVPGDIFDGTGVYQGQELEQYATTAETQLESAIKTLPVGVQWIMLGGNHDYSWMSRAKGYNILARLETEREDVTFVGFDRATVPLLPGVDALLWHGMGGLSYAKSYKLQNAARNLAFEQLEKVIMDGLPPTIRFLFAGHWHTWNESDEGGIECYLAGSFSGSNGLTKRMLVTPSIRGLIVEADLDGKNRLGRLRCDKMIYPEIQDDWKSYNHEVVKCRVLQPLLS
jgi:predicted phosphodiesterase